MTLAKSNLLNSGVLDSDSALKLSALRIVGELGKHDRMGQARFQTTKFHSVGNVIA